MSLGIIAKRYAKALLEIGIETRTLAKVTEDLNDFAAAYETSADLRHALGSPLVTADDKRALVTELATRMGVSKPALHTILMLVERGRGRALPLVADNLRKMGDAQTGVLRAHVTTAVALPDAYFERLKAQLERITERKIVIERSQDPSLIAGVVARIGDRVLDGSLRTQLAMMKDKLLSPV